MTTKRRRYTGTPLSRTEVTLSFRRRLCELRAHRNDLTLHQGLARLTQTKIRPIIYNSEYVNFGDPIVMNLTGVTKLDGDFHNLIKLGMDVGGRLISILDQAEKQL